jgi:hypothetical protein
VGYACGNVCACPRKHVLALCMTRRPPPDPASASAPALGIGMMSPCVPWASTVHGVQVPKHEETLAIVNAVRTAVPRAWPFALLDDARLDDLAHVSTVRPHAHSHRGPRSRRLAAMNVQSQPPPVHGFVVLHCVCHACAPSPCRAVCLCLCVCVCATLGVLASPCVGGCARVCGTCPPPPRPPVTPSHRHPVPPSPLPPRPPPRPPRPPVLPFPVPPCPGVQGA